MQPVAGWGGAFLLWLIRNYARHLWFILKVTVPLMLLAVVLRGSYQAYAFIRNIGSDILNFRIHSQEPFILSDDSGTLWNNLGEAISGKYEGHHLPVVADSYLAEWSEWIMEHPGSEIVSN